MKILQRLFAGLVLVAFVVPWSQLLPRPAQAWRDEGHYSTCHLALLELSREARAEVARLIALDGSTQIFEEGCVWPDDVLYTTRPQTRPWHYMNVSGAGTTVDMNQCPPDNGCLLKAIEIHTAVLADPESPDLERLEALKFLGHWLGDVHQPLHFGSGSDLGGNDVHVIWQAAADPISPMSLNPRETNMHRVWDHEMLDDLRLEPFRYATRLWMAITDEERAAWRDSDPLDWANESRAIAADPATRYVDAGPGAVLELGPEYLQRHFPTVERRLKMGGIRLGHLLNLLLMQPGPKMP